LRQRWHGAGRPDFVHVATPGPLAWSALRAARAEGLPTGCDFRTHFDTYCASYGLGWLEPLLSSWLARLNALADITFVPTPALASALAARGFVRLSVCGRGVDTARFAPAHRDAALRAEWGAAPDDPVLLSVGRLAAEKNVTLALDAFERVRLTHPRARMVVVGDGPQRAALQARCPTARFVGAQTGDALARHYASADVFLFPSLTETFGNVTLEALASGLALVAYDCAAAHLHARDGFDACLAPPGDAPAFVAAAQRAMAHGAPDAVLRRRARETALRASWSSVHERFELALARTVAARRSRLLPQPVAA
jgi:glycosyltransferase involved in cell wall biosynthesis